MWLHVDMKAGAQLPSNHRKENMPAATHAHLPLPVGAGRSIGEGRGIYIPLGSKLADDRWRAIRI